MPFPEEFANAGGLSERSDDPDPQDESKSAKDTYVVDESLTSIFYGLLLFLLLRQSFSCELTNCSL
jgi:hypothetical protein